MIRIFPDGIKGTMRQPLVDWLKKQTDDDRQSIAGFTSGGFIFSAGMMTIILADRLMLPSLRQEWVTLIGLILVFLGAARALWGYLRISLFKIMLLLLDNHHDRRRTDRH